MLVISLAIALGTGGSLADTTTNSVAQDIEWQIHNLGADSPILRKLAFDRLAHYGPEAGEALVRALWSPQRAVLLQVRDLLDRMPRLQPDDPPEAMEVLENYRSRSASERREIGSRLMSPSLPVEKSGPIMLRLIAYESSDVLAWQLTTRLRPWISRSHESLFSVKLPERPATLRLRAWAEPARATELIERAWTMARDRMKAGADEQGRSTLELVTQELMKQYRIQKRYEAMERCWRQMADESRDANAALELMLLLLERNQPERVDQEWQRYGDWLSGDARGLYLMSRVAAIQHDTERERALTTTALSLWPQEPQRHSEAGDYLLHRGWLEAAQGEFQRVLEMCKEDRRFEGYLSNARLRLATIFEHRHQPDKQVEQLQAAVRLFEGFQERGDAGEEVTALVKDLKCRLLLATADKEEKAGNAKAQEKALRDTLTLWPHHPDAVIGLAKFLQKSGNTAELTKVVDASREFYQGRIAEHPTEAEDYNNLAWLLANTGSHLDEACQMSIKSLELAPDTAAYLDTLAEVYLRQGQVQRAVELEHQAVEIEPESLDLVDRLKIFEETAAKSKP